MSTATGTADRYRIEPTMLQAPRRPRLLTRELNAGLVTALALVPEPSTGLLLCAGLLGFASWRRVLA